MQTITTKTFVGLQQLGRALTVPISVLPLAGILFRLGQPDLLNMPILAAAGYEIFNQLSLVFAIGIAVGLARDNHGVAGISGAVGELIMKSVLHAISPDVDMGVFSGLWMGVVAGTLYNRFHDIKLPRYLEFFGGKRFVPLVTGLLAILLGQLFGSLWPSIQSMTDSIGHYLIGAGGWGVFLYGFLNRIFLITGLHHVLNSFIWFDFGSYTNDAGQLIFGDLRRYYSADPSAGYYLSGYFPIMMFGLPAVCLAMYRHALAENRSRVLSVYSSMALVAFLTGITEPIEFSFMFLAPLLYLLHAVLTGISMYVMYELDVRIGFTFSAGLFDYLLSKPLAQNPYLLIPVGTVYFGIYYYIFSYVFKRFQIPTLGFLPMATTSSPELEPEPKPGSESKLPTDSLAPSLSVDHSGAVVPAPIPAEARLQHVANKLINPGQDNLYVLALGGASNITNIQYCTTRLRIELQDADLVQPELLQAAGSLGYVRLSKNQVQAVIGTSAERVCGEIRAALKASRPLQD